MKEKKKENEKKRFFYSILLANEFLCFFQIIFEKQLITEDIDNFRLLQVLVIVK